MCLVPLLKPELFSNESAFDMSKYVRAFTQLRNNVRRKLWLLIIIIIWHEWPIPIPINTMYAPAHASRASTGYDINYVREWKQK